MEGVAREVLKSDPDVVVTQELMAIAMRNLQSPKPVVFGFSGDPVDGKLVESWARPGTNFTGMSYLAIELVGKRIELLKDWLPQTRQDCDPRPSAAPRGAFGKRSHRKGFEEARN